MKYVKKYAMRQWRSKGLQSCFPDPSAHGDIMSLMFSLIFVVLFNSYSFAVINLYVKHIV